MADQITASRISACFDEITEEKSRLSAKAPVRSSPRRNQKTITSNLGDSATEMMAVDEQPRDTAPRKKRSFGARKKNDSANVTKSDADSTTDADRRPRLAEPNERVTDVFRSPLAAMTDLRLSDDCTASNPNDSRSWQELVDDYKQ